MAGSDASTAVESKLNELLGDIEKHLDADVLTYFGLIQVGTDDIIRDAIAPLKKRKKKLVFVLETDGGFAETARRIADTVRNHYRTVIFLIPNHAMSAGTILAMSGDEIWMDDYSVLGPIDPQVRGQDRGRLIPAIGYLIRYEDLLKKANLGKAGPAELQILFNFDQGELYAFGQARDLSISLLEEWLVSYKFRNWKRTKTRGIPVTRKMKRDRAVEIGEKLNNVRRWNSHGIGINMRTIRRELKLEIVDFGRDKPLRPLIADYHRLATDYTRNKLNMDGLIHTRGGFGLLRRS